MSHDGKDGGAKAPIAKSVEAPNAPTTKARREIAAFLVGNGGFACCGEGVGAFVDSEGVVLG